MEAFTESHLTEKIKYVAVYLRKSRGTGDMEEDLVKHRMKINEFCDNFGWAFVVYEEIVSGHNIENRPEIQRLLTDVEKELYDAVFVFDVDRLSRGGSIDQEMIYSTFRDTGTLLVTANPFKIYDMNDESDDTMIDVLGFVGKMEYKQIRKRMIAGKKIGLMGRWVYGNTPYGYVYNNKTKRLETVKEEKNIIRELVDNYLNDISTNKLAEDLNSRKIPSPRGSNWTPVTIGRIFKSTVYQGHIVGNKYETNYKKGKAYQRKLLPESEWVIVKNCHETIITEEESEQIKKKLKISSKKRYKNKIHAFTGLIKCGKCGMNMYNKPFGDNEGIAKCPCGNIGGFTNLIETAVYETAVRLKKELNEIKVDDIKLQKQNKLSNKIKNLTDTMNKQDFAIKQIEDAFEAGLYDISKTRAKIEERQQEKQRLKKEVSLLKTQLNSTNKNDNREKISKIDQFIIDIKENTSPEKKNKIYKDVIKEIIWVKEIPTELDITINFP